MEEYSILGRIGEGAHGIVFKAKHIETGETVALKKVALRRLEDGIPNQALREIKALQEIEDNQHDLKPANLLISSSGHLKIADFGLARLFTEQEDRLYSHQVATRWYRAPELLYGARKYDEGVDLWAVGCIFGELLNLSPLFPGENDIEQLCCVLRVLGTPTEDSWPVRPRSSGTLATSASSAFFTFVVYITNEIVELPDYNKITFKENPAIPLEQIVPDSSPQAVDLLYNFLVYPSYRRCSARQALLHPFFFSSPIPAHHSELPIPERGGRLPHQRLQAPPSDFSVDLPLHCSMVDPALLRGHAS
ncbi:cyclin-dependent kinase 20 isoform X7 [Gasterosteus aculeatus]|uniref:cyclin-dependent kinase 20 isoform X6 n=1 Tax=Gasterosteus aculeatus aculeatus TaxID=481459 RepID=UPI001A9995F1|nr:cyclin-dependent kinase 20 isoform X6 [Gasterosteus aculeatus aculeatus]